MVCKSDHNEEFSYLYRKTFADLKARSKKGNSLEKYRGLLEGRLIPDGVLDLADRTAAIYEVVENIFDIAEDTEGLWLPVKREGLHEERDFR